MPHRQWTQKLTEEKKIHANNTLKHASNTLIHASHVLKYANMLYEQLAKTY